MEGITRLYIEIYGLVQGVGFRPYVHRLASDLGLKGFVSNTSQGVLIDVEGPIEALKTFIQRLPQEKPEICSIYSFNYRYLDPRNYPDFQIKASDHTVQKTSLIMPDLATCDECLKEVFNPQDRRYFYPFTNCTHCGPRYTIIEALPYDRPNTSMKNFIMCDLCRQEYEDPRSRRFHAQPNACPDCGPQLELWDTRGEVISQGHKALQGAVQSIKAGKIIAVKGLGGFHLMCDALNGAAIKELREKKHREQKPFALMFRSLGDVRKVAEVSNQEEQLLLSNQAPIVLLDKRRQDPGIILPDAVAPEAPQWGIVLPYTPLHHILLNILQTPVIATSANISDEPLCIDEQEARQRLNGIADQLLVHNRPIVRHCDDSIVRFIRHRSLVLRRARGYAPLPFPVSPSSDSILGVGAQLKNTVALQVHHQIFISQHIGDLETKLSYETFRSTIDSLCALYEAPVTRMACDAHPQYFSTQYALGSHKTCIKVQHHHAHIAACMIENQIDGTVLGVAWDGTGYGPDQTVWGGEFLKARLDDYQRLGTIYPFPLPGGEVAVKEPRRTAVALLWTAFGDDLGRYQSLPALQAFSADEFSALMTMLKRNVNCPASTSVGRLFDGVSSICGLKQVNHYEGQAPIALENCLRSRKTGEAYSFKVTDTDPAHQKLVSDEDLRWIVDWRPMLPELIQDLTSQKTLDIVSEKFHNTLILMLIEVSKRAGLPKVVLSGGCFQNRYLLEQAVERLEAEGFQPYWHQHVPPNDGGISLGQVAVCHYRSLKEREKNVRDHLRHD